MCGVARKPVPLECCPQNVDSEHYPLQRICGGCMHAHFVALSLELCINNLWVQLETLDFNSTFFIVVYFLFSCAHTHHNAGHVKDNDTPTRNLETYN